MLLPDGRPVAAEQHFRRAIELDPGYACAHRERGFVLLAHTVEEEGFCPKRAAELDSEDLWVHIYLGKYWWRCSDPDGDWGEFRIAGSIRPQWSVISVCQGEIFADDRNDMDMAQGLFKDALQWEPDCVMGSTAWPD